MVLSLWTRALRPRVMNTLLGRAEGAHLWRCDACCRPVGNVSCAGRKGEGAQSYRFLIFPTLIIDISMPNLPGQRHHSCRPLKKN